MNSSMAGTRNAWVMRSRSIAARNSAGSNVENATVCPPAQTVSSSMVMPATWKVGKGLPLTSSAANCQSCATVSQVDSRPRWVSTTPLGRPVVPEEYNCRASSCGLSASGGSTAG